MKDRHSASLMTTIELRLARSSRRPGSILASSWVCPGSVLLDDIHDKVPKTPRKTANSPSHKRRREKSAAATARAAAILLSRMFLSACPDAIGARDRTEQGAGSVEERE